MENPVINTLVSQRVKRITMKSNQIQYRFVHKAWGPWPSPSGKFWFPLYQPAGRSGRLELTALVTNTLAQDTGPPFDEKSDECRRIPMSTGTHAVKGHPESTVAAIDSGLAVRQVLCGIIYTWPLITLSTILGGGHYSHFTNEDSEAQIILLRFKHKIMFVKIQSLTSSPPG